MDTARDENEIAGQREGKTKGNKMKGLRDLNQDHFRPVLPSGALTGRRAEVTGIQIGAD